MRSETPTFGRRGRSLPVADARPPSRHATRPAVDALHQDPAHAAVFAALRADAGEPDRQAAPVVVPRSLRAALLAGIFVGCALVGLDLAGIGRALHPIAAALHLDRDDASALPLLLVLGIIGGARTVATTLLLAHTALRRLGWTHHGAYAMFGAVAALVPTAVLGLAAGVATGHGWAADAAAGAAGGFLYRVFAGATDR